MSLKDKPTVLAVNRHGRLPYKYKLWTKPCEQFLANVLQTGNLMQENTIQTVQGVIETRDVRTPNFGSVFKNLNWSQKVKHKISVSVAFLKTNFSISSYLL